MSGRTLESQVAVGIVLLECGAVELVGVAGIDAYASCGLGLGAGGQCGSEQKAG